MRFQVSGQKDLYRLAHNLHEAGQKNLKRQLDKASRQAGNEIAREVQQHTKDYIPANFERRFDTAFVTEVQVRLVASRRITIVFSGRGKSGERNRDIKAMNSGNLKHPVFGRYRRLKDGSLMKNPWVSKPPQKIRPGLVDEPAQRATPRARKKIEDAIDRVSQQIERG
jgi:hypothetical protein